VTWATSRNFLQAQDGIASGAEKLATSGLPGLAIVVLASCVVWLTIKLLSEKQARLDDAKGNTTEMLKLADKTNVVVVQVTGELTTTRETLKTVSEKLEETTQALNESNEIMRTLKEQRMRR